MRIVVIATTVCFSIFGMCRAGDVPAAIRKPINIPAQDLGTALRSAAQDRELYVIYASQDVEHLRTSGATGALTTDETFKQLLEGSGLTYRFIDDKTVTILPARKAQDSVQKSNEQEAQKSTSFWDRFRVAQVDAGPAVSERAPSASSDATPAVLEEIVVTAQKRLERIQDVPMSIGVVSAADIERRGLSGAADYLRGMPGVNQTESNVGTSVVIRGLETTTSFQGFGSGNTVASYFGETSTTSASGVIAGAAPDLKLVDVSRVEVLRGPQGTAFGSSALGGVVRVIPKAPDLTAFSGKLGVGNSFTSGSGGDNQMYQAVGNIPLVRDKLALRVVGYRFEDSGFYRNVAATDAELQARAVAFGAQSFARNEEEVGTAKYTGGRAALLWQPLEDLKFTLTYLKQKTEVEGWAGSNRTGYDQAILRVGPENLVRGLPEAGQEYTIDLTNLLMEYHIGWADVVATYSHIGGDAAQAFPFSARPAGVLQLPMVTASFSEHSENSGEIRLTSRFDGAWNFLAGLYTEHLDDYWEQPVYWYGNPATAPVALTQVNGNQLFSGSLEWLELEQKAAFAEVSWQFAPQFTLTGGARYYDYDRKVRDSSILTGVTTTLAPISTNGTNFRGNLSYKPGEDVLLYAAWAQGFRLGKPQLGLSATPTCDLNQDGVVDGTNLSVASTRTIQSDAVDSYELGTKFRLFERLSVSGDVFRANWDDIPVQVQQACGAVSVGYTANAGRARSQGVEMQATFDATDVLRVDAGMSWVDATLLDDVPAQGFRAGDRLPSPKTNANLGVQYLLSAADRRIALRADSIYVGHFYSTVGNRIARNAAGGYVKLDASVSVPVGALTIDGFVNNVLGKDETTYVLNNNTALLLRPRTYGVRLSYEF